MTSYDKRRKLAIHNGTWLAPFIPADQTVAHLNRLFEIGYTPIALARVAGVSEQTIRMLRTGRRHDNPARAVTRVRRTTASAILAVPVDDTTLIPDKTRVDAARTRQQVAELRQLGWTMRRIAAEAGMPGDRLQIGTDLVLASTARRIERVHEIATRPRHVELDEVEALLGTDTPEGIAARLGYSQPDSIVKAMRRHGRHDLIPRYLGRAA